MSHKFVWITTVGLSGNRTEYRGWRGSGYLNIILEGVCILAKRGEFRSLTSYHIIPDDVGI